MLSNKLFLLLLSLTSAVSLTACNAVAGKPSEQGKPSAARGMSALESRIDQAVMRLIDVEGRNEKKTPGLVVAYIWPGGSNVKGYGTKKIGTVDPPDGDTKFAIASVTKVFTGLMLAQAVTSGKLSLDDKVQPSLNPPLKDLFDPWITYLQLVTHTSGLVDYPTNLKDYRDNNGDGKPDFVEGNPANLYSEQNLATCMQQTKCGKLYPSKKARYSNLGSGILGMALENELGFDNYADLLKGVITGPLGMSDTGIFEGEFARRLPERVAQGYEIRGGNVREAPYPNMGVLAGGGGIFTTGRDMLKFLGAVTGLEDSGLSGAISEMRKKLVETDKGRVMGYAMSIESSGGTEAYSKGGGVMGYSAYLLWKDDPRVGVMVMANRGKFQKPASKLAEKIIAGLSRNL